MINSGEARVDGRMCWVEDGKTVFLPENHKFFEISVFRSLSVVIDNAS